MLEILDEALCHPIFLLWLISNQNQFWSRKALPNIGADWLFRFQLELITAALDGGEIKAVLRGGYTEERTQRGNTWRIFIFCKTISWANTCEKEGHPNGSAISDQHDVTLCLSPVLFQSCQHDLVNSVTCKHAAKGGVGEGISAISASKWLLIIVLSTFLSQNSPREKYYCASLCRTLANTMISGRRLKLAHVRGSSEHRWQLFVGSRRVNTTPVGHLAHHGGSPL